MKAKLTNLGSIGGEGEILHPWAWAFPKARQVVILAVLCSLLPASSSASPGRALKDYEQGQYHSARQEYQRLLERKPEDPRLQYNTGTAAYQAREYDTAARHLTNALAAPDLKLQEQAYYNLGNTLYRIGENASDTNAIIQTWEQSLQSYESALKLNDQDADAKFNRDFVKKRLEELKKEQQKNQEKNRNQDKKQDKNQDKNQDQQDKQNQQDQAQNKDQNQKDQQPKQAESSKQDQQAEADRSSRPSDEKGDEQPSEAPAKPGQMTRQQAQQLLDAQKNDEKALLLLPPELRQQRNRSFKNW